ncbi:hypothetical protein OH76DRAFT_733162 [Lentinus brumalis]|uniref:Uncharacterized protein n=1 Tax=Lentinus brumalis TaxID=2498619 RepID=A0A371DS85_9APHY|nr:hypothetical protein OH76DRAFT_733162 [Polyporus brumalis]
MAPIPKAADSPEEAIAPRPYLDLAAGSPCGEGSSQEDFPCTTNLPERGSYPLPGVCKAMVRMAVSCLQSLNQNVSTFKCVAAHYWSEDVRPADGSSN